MSANKIPGCVVTSKLVAELAEEAKTQDKGKSTRLLRAAKLYAITKGMGYAGAHIGGHGITSDMVEFIITQGEELSKNWQSLVAEFDYPQPDGFLPLRERSQNRPEHRYVGSATPEPVETPDLSVFETGPSCDLQ